MKGLRVAGYNRVIIVGNLTRDPDYNQLSSGQAVCKLGIASNRQYKNKQTGSMVQEVCFVDVDVFGPQADSCKQYLQKGRAVLIEGRLKFDTWESPDGQKRSKHSIIADRVVFLSFSPGDTDDLGRSQANDQNADLAKELLGSAPAQPQSKAVKPAVKNEAPRAEASQEGDAAFKDEPPFQDDLPF